MKNKHTRLVMAAAVLGLSLPSLSYGAIIISEVDPGGSSTVTNNYSQDWFELTNTGASAVDITGWKMDDNSHAFASAVALRGVTSIAPGQSVVFVEGNTSGSNDGTLDTAFKAFWFGANVPAGFTIGNYGGSSVGLSQTADEVNLYNAAGAQVTGVGFGATSAGVSLDNFVGAGTSTQPVPTISTTSAAGVHGAFNSANAQPSQANEIGSPGFIANAKYALTTNNDATLGTLNSKSLAVTGNNGQYADPGPSTNYAPANGTKGDYAIANANLGVGAEVPVLVMVDFDLGTSGLTMAELKADFQNVGDVAATTIVGPGDADPLGQYNLLLSQYSSFNADAAHVMLFEFLTAPGAVANGLHFGFDLTGSGVSVLQTMAVPEPGSLALLGTLGIGILRPHRRRAR